jgi:hypothetical protein
VRYCYSVSDTTEAIPDVEAQEPTLLVQWDKTGEVDEFSLEAYELYMQEI